MRALLAFTLSFGLLGCGASDSGADRILAQPDAAQEDALVACHAALGTPHALIINELKLNDGRVLLSATNKLGGGGMTLAEARSINGCARNRLLSGQSAPAVAPVPAQNYAPQTYAAEPAADSYATRTYPSTQNGYGTACDGSVLVGGTSYCVAEAN